MAALLRRLLVPDAIVRLDLDRSYGLVLADAPLWPLGSYARLVVLDPWTDVGTGVGLMGIRARLRQLVPAWFRQPTGFRTIGGSPRFPSWMGGRSPDIVRVPRILRQSPRRLGGSSSTHHSVLCSANGARRHSSTVAANRRDFPVQRRRGSKAGYTSSILSCIASPRRGGTARTAPKHSSRLGRGCSRIAHAPPRGPHRILEFVE